MALYLIESSLDGNTREEGAFRARTDELQRELGERGAKLLEVQVSQGFERAFFIADGGEEAVRAALAAASVPVELLKEVRLIGKQPEEVQPQGEGLNYLVEWNLPEHLTMEQYLERKKKNSVHYTEVPEVSFSRTYVCEDMTKCLCFYKAPDEEAVKRAREAVHAPIDALTAIRPQE